MTAAGLLAGAMAMSATLFTGCEKNVPTTVYGPPEWFDPDNNVQDDVYGPPEWFNPTDEAPEDIEIEVEEPQNGGEAEGQNGQVQQPDGGQQPEGGQTNPADPGPQTDPNVPSYDPNQNIQEPAYGPPEWYNPIYDPNNNIPETVYGPPEWFDPNYDPDAPENQDDEQVEEPKDPQQPSNGEEGSTQTGSKKKKSDEDDNKPAPQEPAFDPGQNQNVDVYGPPEYFGLEPAEPAPAEPTPDEPAPEEPAPAEPPQPDVLVPEPVPFDPEDNRLICMYGPPEWFNPDWGKPIVIEEPIRIEEPIPVPTDPTLVGE